MKKVWLLVALVNLLLATCIGVLLRYAFVEEVSWMKFKNFLHAHSHVAMLGWIYMALYALLIHNFLPAEQQRSRAYNWLFWFTQFSVVGMLVSFPIQGYGPISIAFSTVHIILSYIFAGWFWADMGKADIFSKKMIRTALIFMVISTLGVWVMGPIMATKLRSSAFYYMAVQFYLHFQFNGWFLFSVLGLFFKHLETKNIILTLHRQKLFYWLLAVSCLLTYALAVAWAEPLASVFLVNSVGVILQLLAIIIFIMLIWPKRAHILDLFNPIEITLLKIAFYSFVFKIVIQASVAVPFVAKAAYTIRNYVIGFIHLILLGAITFFLLSIAFNNQILSGRNTLSRMGLWSIIAGFILSESLLFLQGTMFWGAMGFLPFYYELLFAVSILIPLGIALLIGGNFQKNFSIV
ncbi:MAG: hypothetical protein IPJ74_03960 [Saprospiraceae bacterium]|nr:hypothetical protein [Saprospiraceae bacterium]